MGPPFLFNAPIPLRLYGMETRRCVFSYRFDEDLAEQPNSPHPPPSLSQYRRPSPSFPMETHRRLFYRFDEDLVEHPNFSPHSLLLPVALHAPLPLLFYGSSPLCFWIVSPRIPPSILTSLRRRWSSGSKGVFPEVRGRFHVLADAPTRADLRGRFGKGRGAQQHFRQCICGLFRPITLLVYTYC